MARPDSSVAKGRSGGCICGRLIKSNDSSDEQQALTAKWKRFVWVELRGKWRGGKAEVISGSNEDAGRTGLHHTFPKLV